MQIRADSYEEEYTGASFHPPPSAKSTLSSWQERARRVEGGPESRIFLPWQTSQGELSSPGVADK